MKVITMILTLLLLALVPVTFGEWKEPGPQIVWAQEQSKEEEPQKLFTGKTSRPLPTFFYVGIPIVLLSFLLIFVNRRE